MLYQHKKTGARVKLISEFDNGDWFMVEDQDGKIYTAYKSELEADKQCKANLFKIIPGILLEDK